jgi:hypothetical protein
MEWIIVDLAYARRFFAFMALTIARRTWGVIVSPGELADASSSAYGFSS